MLYYKALVNRFVEVVSVIVFIHLYHYHLLHE